MKTTTPNPYSNVLPNVFDDTKSGWIRSSAISEEHYNIMKTITNKVNEKYIEMGGITAISVNDHYSKKYCDLANILDYILEEKLQDNSVLEEMVKHIEKDKEENPKDYK